MFELINPRNKVHTTKFEIWKYSILILNFSCERRLILTGKLFPEKFHAGSGI